MRNKNFINRLCLTQTLSFLGTATLSFGIGIWIYEKTQQTLNISLGVVSLYLPVLFCSKLVDRYETKFLPEQVLLVTNSGNAFLWLITWLLIQNLQYKLPLIYLALFISGIFRAFQIPAMSLTIREHSANDQLQHNVALFSFGTACINIIIPALSILLLKINGIKTLLLFNVLSYPLTILVLACFLKKNFNYNGEYTIKNKL